MPHWTSKKLETFENDQFSDAKNHNSAQDQVFKDFAIYNPIYFEPHIGAKHIFISI